MTLFFLSCAVVCIGQIFDGERVGPGRCFREGIWQAGVRNCLHTFGRGCSGSYPFEAKKVRRQQVVGAIAATQRSASASINNAFCFSINADFFIGIIESLQRNLQFWHDRHFRIRGE